MECGLGVMRVPACYALQEDFPPPEQLPFPPPWMQAVHKVR